MIKPVISVKRVHRYRYPCMVLFVPILVLLSGTGFGQITDKLPSSLALKKLSLEELMSIEVTSVSRQPEKLIEVASAIQVITQEDIKRSGATNLPDALRLSPNLQVSQIRSNAWVISARGFNAAFSNKLLVMIDGRTVYSPLFAGVFWDAQSVLLEDIERIEVISGPGGSIWGANAVNGIINIITKNTRDTKGLYVSAAAGNLLKDFGAIRFGGNAGSSLSYRVFAQRSDYSNTFMANNEENKDEWDLTQGGFRLDYTPPGKSAFMLQGNLYGGVQQTSPESPMNGQNILGRFTHTISEQSNFSVQVYADRTWRRDVPSTITDNLVTYDIDLQHRFPLGKHHNFMWGAGYRFMHNRVINNSPIVGLLPTKRDMNLYSGFVQDEISLLNAQLKLTIGTKYQHYTFSGSTFQPSVRAAWIPNAKNTVWIAASRAIRAPSRIDVDYYLPTYTVPPGSVNVAGGPDFEPEKLNAYELGYRVQPDAALFFSLALFYNKYNDLYSVEPLPGTLTYQTQNGTQGYSNGVELSGTFKVIRQWQLRGGYTYFFKHLENKPGHSYDYSALGNDPKSQFLLQSIVDLPGNFQFDVMVRYASALPNPYTPDYLALNTHLAWTYKQFEISLTGQNLLKSKHSEYGSTRIPRNLYAKLTCRF